MPTHYDTSKLSGNLRHPKRNWWQSLKRGAHGNCPSCGEGTLTDGYLKIVDKCEHCGEEMHHHRADDAPPYFTIFIVGHVVLPLLILLEAAYTPPLWVHMAIWLPMATILSLWLLPIVKGALVGYQWALYMHDFDPDERGKPTFM